MEQYLTLIKDILTNGVERKDRTGTGTRSVFGRQLRFDLATGFPLVTTKRLHLKSIVYELLWFLKGETNVKFLNDHGVRIWDAWADLSGELGPIYGSQWRSWTSANGHCDQISDVITQIKTNPESRRLIVSAWNVGELDKMALQPCHVLFQFYVVSGKLSCQLYQRSADVFLGLPFNIASYSLLTHIIADQCGLQAAEFVWVGGDVHLYENHLEQARIQLTRSPLKPPRLELVRRPDSFLDYCFDDFKIVGYTAHPHISAPVAI